MLERPLVQDSDSLRYGSRAGIVSLTFPIGIKEISKFT